MNDDKILHDAARVLREDADASKARPDETRARIMRSLTARRNRRLAAIRVFVPIAAVLIGSVAWASATNRLPSVFYEMASKLGLGESEHQAPEIPAHKAPGNAKARPIASIVMGEDELNAPLLPVNDEDSAKPDSVQPAPEKHIAVKPEAPKHSHVPEPEMVPAPVSPAPLADTAGSAAVPMAPAPSAPSLAPADPDAHALYQTAHHAHFVDRNSSAALSAWDAYLAAAPRGRFAVEARYNRALCLVRLGRMNEARPTLETFANATAGSYRQAEARALLDAMNNAPKQ